MNISLNLNNANVDDLRSATRIMLAAGLIEKDPTLSDSLIADRAITLAMLLFPVVGTGSLDSERYQPHSGNNKNAKKS